VNTTPESRSIRPSLGAGNPRSRENGSGLGNNAHPPIVLWQESRPEFAQPSAASFFQVALVVPGEQGRDGHEENILITGQHSLIREW
jgi:hypothetical protein